MNLFKLISAALLMRPGSKVVLSEPGNFPTDLYMIAGLEAQGLAERRLAERDELEAALDEDVALLLLTHVHYKTGAMHDMARLTKAAHDVGALVLWDLSHSAGRGAGRSERLRRGSRGRLRLQVPEWRPWRAGLRLCRTRHHDALRQPLTGWMGHAAPFAFTDDYAPAPGIERLLAGTPPILGLAALEEGVKLIAEIGLDRLVAKSRALCEFLRAAPWPISRPTCRASAPPTRPSAAASSRSATRRPTRSARR